MREETVNYEQLLKKTKINNKIRNILLYIFLGIWAVIVLFPFYWMILTSIKNLGAYNAETIPKFFAKPTLDNYITAFTTIKLSRYRVE